MRNVALDFSSLDQLKISNGQYRYAIDLIRGLARTSDYQFRLLGSQPGPPAELTDIFAGDTRWTYCQLPHARFRGGYFVDHIKFASSLYQWRVDLLHALHTFVPRVCPCRVVVTEHDLMFDLFEEYAVARTTRPYRWYRRSVAKAERIIAISETTARDLIQLHQIDPARIDVVYHGSTFASVLGTVRPARPDLRQEYAATLLSPYNLEPRKNIRVLLEAVASLKTKFPRLQLVLFGQAALTPEREKAFECWLDEYGIRHLVTRLGFVEDNELKTWYEQSSAFVFPSLYEGFGLPILEAMASGACVIARNASAMAEIVGSAGLLVETARAKDLSSCIEYVLEHPAECDSLRRAAQLRAKQFTVERMASETAASYEKALQSRTSGRRAGEGRRFAARSF